MTNQLSIFQEAAALVRVGLAVFPVRCRSKKPATRNGFYAATKALDELPGLFPHGSNIGVATGRVSGVWVLDVDHKSGGEESLASLVAANGGMPATPTVNTGGGGMHLYFALPSPDSVVPSSAGLVADGLDVRGDGGYVVAPPSVHVSRVLYQWQPGKSPQEIPFAPAPEWLLELATAPAAKRKAATSKAFTGQPRSYLEAAFVADGLAIKRISKGRTIVVCPWQSDHTSGFPGDGSTVLFAATAESTRGQFHCSHAHCHARTFDEVIAALSPQARAAPRPDAAQIPEPPGSPPTVHLMRGTYVELADEMARRLPQHHMVISEGGAIYRYATSGIWEPIPASTLPNLVASFDGASMQTEDGFKAYRLSGSVASAAVKLYTSRIKEDSTFFAPEHCPHVVGFRDCCVSVSDDGVISTSSHCPTNRLRHVFPFDYDPRAPSDLLDAFMQRVFQDVSEAERESRISLLQEFIGSCLFGAATRFQKVLICLGHGGTGKSETAKLLIDSFPRESVAHVSPHVWEDRFGLNGLVGKSINLVGELPRDDIVKSAAFKAVVTGDPVTSERKYGGNFEFVPTCGHLFLANELPRPSDVSGAFFRRCLVLPFTHKFVDHPDLLDRDAASRVLAEERPAIVNWAILGYARAVRNGFYTLPDTAKEEHEEWVIEANPVEEWARECVERSDTATPLQALFRAYSEWASERGYSKMATNTLSRRLRSLGVEKIRRSSGVWFKCSLKGDQAYGSLDSRFGAHPTLDILRSTAFGTDLSNVKYPF